MFFSLKLNKQNSNEEGTKLRVQEKENANRQHENIIKHLLIEKKMENI